MYCLPVTDDYKFGMMYDLVYQYFAISSNWNRFRKELFILIDIFLKNGYPLLYSDNCFKLFLNKSYVQRLKLTRA